MRQFTIDHPHNEASALVAIHNRRLLDHYGWEVGFWIVSDEAPVHKALAALGRRRPKGKAPKGDDDGNGRWEVVKVRCDRTGPADTDDCEAMARAGGWIYIFGSQYGPKTGPLDPSRHFVARFNESLVEPGRRKLSAELQVARRPFALHRIVNDALRKSDLALIPVGEQTRDAFIKGTRKGLKGPHRKRVRKGDHPINVEGATFLPNGRLLLGLRFPVTADGHPILVEIDGIDRLLTPGGGGRKRTFATRVWTLSNVGRKAEPTGIRELDQRGLTVHALTGSIERKPEDSKILQDHPAGERAGSAHWTFQVPDDDETVRLKAEPVRTFHQDGNVEGFTLFEDGCVWYAHDDECIRLSEAGAGGE